MIVVSSFSWVCYSRDPAFFGYRIYIWHSGTWWNSEPKTVWRPFDFRDRDVIVTSWWRHNHENQKSFKLAVLYLFSKVLRLIFTILGKFHHFWKLGVIWWRHQPLKSQIYPKIGIFRNFYISFCYFGIDLTNKHHKSMFGEKRYFLLF